MGIAEGMTGYTKGVARNAEGAAGSMASVNGGPMMMVGNKKGVTGIVEDISSEPLMVACAATIINGIRLAATVQAVSV